MAEMTEAQRRAYEAALSRGGVTPAQRRAFEAAQERIGAAQEVRNAVPTQRLRSAAQGLTFGGADEAEAYLSSMFTGKPYEEALNEVRGKLKAYQGARPWEALGYEAGGAALPAIVASVFSGGTAAPAAASRLFPSLARAAAIGAGQGGAYAFGTGEGGLAERAARVPVGAAAGAVAAPLASLAVSGASRPLTALLDVARRRLGGRGAKIVEAELQRIAREGGFTPDEAAQRVASGQIVAETETLRDIVRAYRTLGGEAATTLQQTLPRRAQEGREAAMSQMQRYLAGGADPNVLRQVRQADDVARAAERQAYAPFKSQEAPPEVVNQLGEALRRVPSAAEEVAMALRAETGQSLFFTIGENGAVSFTRAPTVAEAESVRRALDNRATALYRTSMGGAGEAVSGVAAQLRGLLDVLVPELASTRANAAALRGARDAFEAGRRSFSKSADEVAVEFENLTDPQAIEAYRAGLMDALRRKYSTGQQASLMGILNNPERKEGAILRSVFPQDQLPDVLQTIQNAARSQQTANYVVGGSQTAPSMRQAERVGMNIAAEDVSGVLSLDPMALGRVTMKLVNNFAPELTDAQRKQVVDVLVSQNPEVVRRAFQDESGMAVLQRGVQSLVEIIKGGARPAAAVGATQGATGLLAQ